MPFQKEYESPSTGAIATYHVVQQVGLDKVAGMTTVTVASYVSAETKDAGKFALYTQQIQLAEMPGEGQDAFAFAESSLVEAEPVDAAPALSANRYVFAGAQLIT